MISTKHRSGAGRASRRPLVPLILLTAATLAGAAACSSGTSTASSGAGSSSPSGSASAASSSSPPAALSAYFPGKKATGTQVKIGLINNEGSSPAAEPSLGDAAVAAADYANAELGGIGGHQIQVDRCSENEDTASAASCANQMVQDQVAAVVIGSTGFGATMVPIITKAGIPYVAVTGAAAAEGNTPGTFMWSGGYVATLGGFAKYAAQQGYKKVTAYSVDVPAALAGASAIGNPLFKAAGVGLTISPVPTGVPDATSQVTAGLQSKPDAVAIIADEGTCTSILKALAIVDPSVPRMVITSCLTTAATKALGSTMNGVKVFGASAPQASDPEAQLYRFVMAKYAPKANATGYTVTGYQSMLGLVRATAGLKGDPTPQSITAAIKAAKDVPLPAGGGLTFTCDGKAITGQPSDCSSGEVVVTVQNGVGVDPQVIR
jgi:branched-chain amino acid transport system substrate-binding protein